MRYEQRKLSVGEMLNLIKRASKMVHACSPAAFPATIISAILSSFAPFATLYLSARILDLLIITKSNDYTRELALYVLLMVGINLVSHILVSALNGYLNSQYYKLSFYSKQCVSEDFCYTDFLNFEDAGFLNKKRDYEEIVNMRADFLNMHLFVLGNFIKCVFPMLFSIIMAVPVFLTSQAGTGGSWLNSPILTAFIAAAIIVSAVLDLLLKKKLLETNISMTKKIAESNRMSNYYENIIMDYRLGKEIRLHRIQKLLFNEAAAFFLSGAKTLFKAWGSAEARAGGLSALSASLLGGIIYFYVALKALEGLLSIGSVLLYVGAVSRFTGAFSEFVEALGGLGYSTKLLSYFYDILDSGSKKYKGTIPVEKRDDNEYEIEFKNVSFKYPGTDTYALKELSLKFKVGQRLAVVGMNGSGKTTMIKLLCRLYDPTEGEITLNGINIKKYDHSEYLSIFSVVFQDFRLFSFTLGQNVAANINYDKERVYDSLDRADFYDRLETMKAGLDTPLYKNFEEDGVEISGGEAQKIALARALCKNAPFIVLDEPTAALDPVAEFEIYKKLNDIVGNKTAIYVSHRLSSCRFCDDIAVFHEGQLIQRGSHDELILDEQGKYYELWNAQAQYYK